MSSGNWRRYLKPLVPVYAGAIFAKERLLARGWRQQRRLGHPVISVGSLSAGGAGKTPVVVMLAEALSARGFDVRILTRGYGRSGNSIERVGSQSDAARFGDEPVMITRKLAALKSHATVWVGADRYRAGRMSEQEERSGLQAGAGSGSGSGSGKYSEQSSDPRVVYLLDDGFQHRRLARDVDVVLLTRQDLTDTLLPAGNLREPLKAMQRADVVVLREEEGFAGVISGKAATWFIRRELYFSEGMQAPRKAIAFCGLARPEGFFAMLEGAGVEVAAVSVFRDHHAYSSADVEGLVELAKLHGSDGFVTTEKDAVKISPAMAERLGAVAVPQLRLKLMDEQAALDGLLRLLEAKLLQLPDFKRPQ